MRAIQLDTPCKGFDTIAPISASKAAEFKVGGWDFRIGYVAKSIWMPQVPMPGPRGITYLSRDCVGWSMDAGLAVGAVQQYGADRRPRGYDAGYLEGVYAAANLLGIGVREPIHLWYDLEYGQYRYPDNEVLDTIAGWTDAVKKHSPFRRGLYYCYGWLTAAQLWSIPGVNSYWRAAPRSLPTPDHRGAALQQHAQKVRHGVMVDRDDLVTDLKGDTPFFAAA